MPIRILKMLGAEVLIVSNAAGGVNPAFDYGDLMVIKDHICLPALCGFSPFIGSNDPRFGERFVSVHNAYDKKLRCAIHVQFSLFDLTLNVLKFLYGL